MFIYALLVASLTIISFKPKKQPNGKYFVDITGLFYVPILGRILGLW